MFRYSHGPLLEAGVGQSCLLPSLDAIFVLGKGYLMFDNSNAISIPAEKRQQNPDLKWILKDLKVGVLRMFFLELIATTRRQLTTLDPAPYVKDWDWTDVGFGS